MIRQALILCGGLGTRLRPLTYSLPKPMVPVNDKPFLEYQIEYLKKFGIDKIILATGYLHKIIEGYFNNKAAYSFEDQPLGTGGALKNAEKLLDNDFLVLNGDTFFKINYENFFAFHKNKKSSISIALKYVNEVKSSGYVEINENNQIINFTEKNQNKKNGLINAGIYIINKRMLSRIPASKNISLEYDIFPKLTKQIYGYIDDGYFIDIGTFDNYNKFKKEFKKIYE